MKSAPKMQAPIDDISSQSVEFAEPYRSRWASYVDWLKANGKQPLPVREDDAVSWLLTRAADGETDFERRLSIHAVVMGYRLSIQGFVPGPGAASAVLPPGVLGVRIAHAFGAALREGSDPKFAHTVQDRARAVLDGERAVLAAINNA